MLRRRNREDEAVEAMVNEIVDLVRRADEGDEEAKEIVARLNQEFDLWMRRRRARRRRALDARRAWLYGEGSYPGSPIYNIFSLVSYLMGGSRDGGVYECSEKPPAPPSGGGGDSVAVEQFNDALRFFYENRISVQRALEVTDVRGKK